MLHAAWTVDSFECEMQAYEHISLQYYYLGMIEKSSQYHKRVLRGPDPNDRPKGYEAGRSKRLRVQRHELSKEVERVPISKRQGETFLTVYDGSTKVISKEDKEYEHTHEMQSFSKNLWQRITRDIEEIVRNYRNPEEEVSPDLLKVPEPASLYQQSKHTESAPGIAGGGGPKKAEATGKTLTNWHALSQATLEKSSSSEDLLDAHLSKKEALIRQFLTRLHLLLQPRVVI